MRPRLWLQLLCWCLTTVADAYAAFVSDRPEIAPQDLFGRQTNLSMGGGIVGGVLQPLKGVLSGIELPVPQRGGATFVPDAQHPYWIPPNAVRGMCPTLNTLANHGYVSRDGITTFAEVANACQTAFNLDYSTCTLLSALGLLAGGDIATGRMTIGGADQRVPSTLGPALGISHHGPFECDVSITRQDAFFGNQADLHMDRWQAAVDATQAYGGRWTAAAMRDDRVRKYNEGRATNPDFDSSFVGFIVPLVERIFVYRLLANRSDINTAGYADIAPFFLNETFPEGWQRRAATYQGGDLLQDFVADYLAAPTEIGKNQGLGNFIGVGAPQNASALTPDTLACFLISTILAVVPGQTASATGNDYRLVVGLLDGVIKPFFEEYQCDTSLYTAPGPSAGRSEPGPNAKSSHILNGRYI